MSEAVTWDGRTPVSPRFEDGFYGRRDGLEEARHVFLAGNDLLARAGPLHVAELGFGTGLNLAALLHDRGGPLRYTTFERYPLAANDADRALSRWSELDREREAIVAAWPELVKGASVDLAPNVAVRMVVGDADETLPRWDDRADAWFLDGFAPDRNPELWSPALMRSVHDHTAPGGTFATYTAAGHVRRALAAAGFSVERAPGAPGKRHMTRGRRP